MAKLYPPVIEGTIPAFYGTTLVVPFSMNRAVAKSDIKGFSLKIKTVQTNTFVKNLTSTNYTTSQVEFDISNAGLVAGQYYKLQLAYIYNDSYSTLGYYSTVGVVKYYGEDGPTIYVDGLSSKNTNIYTGSFLGVFDHPSDPMEKVAQYRFVIKDSDGEVITDTDWVVHNTINDVNSLSSNDYFKYSDDLDNEKVYYLYYMVITSNNMECSTPGYRILQKNSVGMGLDISLIAENNFDNGYITIKIASENTDTMLTGSYEISRQNVKNPNHWEPIFVFVLQGELPGQSYWRDFTVEQGETYKYCIRQFNSSGMYSDRIYSNEVYADFEDAFLFDGERQLKIKYNPKVSSFKNDILESKTDTIGSKYPFIFRNGHVNYKEFPISGLISYWSDDEELFMKMEDIGIDDISKVLRAMTVRNEISIAHVKYVYNYDADNVLIYGDEDIKTRDQQNARDELVELYENNRKYAVEKFLSKNYKTTDLTNYNIAAERRFKLEVLEWLTNGKPKLFRSPNEGNYIVRLLNTSLTPTDSVGRMLHTFNSTAYEVSEITHDTMTGYGFIDDGIDASEGQREYYRSVTLGYQPYDTDENYKPVITGQNPQYPVDDEGYVELLTNPYNKDEVLKAKTIRFDDMSSSDIVYINNEKRMIGGTGVYNLDNGDEIYSVKVRSVADFLTDEYEAAYQIYLDQINAINHNIEEYQTLIDNATQALDDAEKIIADIRNGVITIQGDEKVEGYDKTINELKEEIKNLTSKINASKKKYADLVNNLNSISADIDKLKKIQDTIVIDGSNIDEKAIKNRISVLRKEIRDLNTNIKKIGKNAYEMEQLISNYSSSLNTDIDTYENNKTTIQQYIDSLSDRQSFTDQITKIKEEIELLDGKEEFDNNYKNTLKSFYNSQGNLIPWPDPASTDEEIYEKYNELIETVFGKEEEEEEEEKEIAENTDEEEAYVDIFPAVDDIDSGKSIVELMNSLLIGSDVKKDNIVGKKNLCTGDNTPFSKKSIGFDKKKWRYDHVFDATYGHYYKEYNPYTSAYTTPSKNWNSVTIKSAVSKKTDQKTSIDKAKTKLQNALIAADSEMPESKPDCDELIKKYTDAISDCKKRIAEAWAQYTNTTDEKKKDELVEKQRELATELQNNQNELDKYNNYLEENYDPEERGTSFKNYNVIERYTEASEKLSKQIAVLNAINDKIKDMFSKKKDGREKTIFWKYFYNANETNETSMGKKPKSLEFNIDTIVKSIIYELLIIDKYTPYAEIKGREGVLNGMKQQLTSINEKLDEEQGAIKYIENANKDLCGAMAYFNEDNFIYGDVMALLTVHAEDNNYYSFTISETIPNEDTPEESTIITKYLTSGPKGNELYFSDQKENCSLWKIEQIEDEDNDKFNIINVNAIYKDTKQALKFYSDFTTFDFMPDIINAVIGEFGNEEDLTDEEKAMLKDLREKLIEEQNLCIFNFYKQQETQAEESSEYSYIKMTTLPQDGEKIVIYHPDSKQALTPIVTMTINDITVYNGDEPDDQEILCRTWSESSDGTVNWNGDNWAMTNPWPMTKNKGRYIILDQENIIHRQFNQEGEISYLSTDIPSGQGFENGRVVYLNGKINPILEEWQNLKELLSSVEKVKEQAKIKYDARIARISIELNNLLFQQKNINAQLDTEISNQKTWNTALTNATNDRNAQIEKLIGGKTNTQKQIIEDQQAIIQENLQKIRAEKSKAQSIVEPDKSDYFGEGNVENGILNDYEGVFTYSYTDDYRNSFDAITGQSLIDMPCKQINSFDTQHNVIKDLTDIRTEIMDVLQVQSEIKQVENIYIYPDKYSLIAEKDNVPEESLKNCFSIDKVNLITDDQLSVLKSNAYAYQIYPILTHESSEKHEDETGILFGFVTTDENPWHSAGGRNEPAGETYHNDSFIEVSVANNPENADWHSPTLLFKGLAEDKYFPINILTDEEFDYLINKEDNFTGRTGILYYETEEGLKTKITNDNITGFDRNLKYYTRGEHYVHVTYHTNELYYTDLSFYEVVYDYENNKYYLNISNPYYNFENENMNGYFLMYDEENGVFKITKGYSTKIYINTGFDEDELDIDLNGNLCSKEDEVLTPYLDLSITQEFKTELIPTLHDIYVGNGVILNLSYHGKQIDYAVENGNIELKNAKQEWENAVYDYTDLFFTKTGVDTYLYSSQESYWTEKFNGDESELIAAIEDAEEKRKTAKEKYKAYLAALQKALDQQEAQRSWEKFQEVNGYE